MRRRTGTGGRIRDVQATGTGANVTAGTVGYSVGQLNIPGYKLPWEDDWEYPSNLAKPLTIEIDASNGASDYGNKFGEPVITGFTRSFGMRLPNGERREYIKPIMFSGGVGQLDDRHLHKGHPEKGMLVVKVGGPAYRIGLGGGAASSRVQDASQAALDFDAVQRGDAEMENKMNRVIRAAIERRGANPIVSIHDQGAGGNGNVLKEISAPNGALLDIRNVVVGDPTMSVRELWGAEFQENAAMLIRPEDSEFIVELGKRENVPVMIMGEITDSGHMVVKDSKTGETAVDLDLELVLGDMPKKTFYDHHVPQVLKPLELPADLTVMGALDRVLRLLSVGSKSFLTNKVDRSVTGLIARQSCCGPLHLPLSDVAVFAQSHFSSTGCATAIGEQPVKGLINPSAMGRLTVGEACTNLVWAAITDIEDVKCSGNWMWASKLEGEGAAMYDCCEAMGKAMIELGVAVDGGKDSLSMAAKVGKELVKAPGTLVVSVYAACPDVSLTVTPDLKHPGRSTLLFVDLGDGNQHLGGSALAQTFKQVGDSCPDTDTAVLKRAFRVTQKLLRERLLLAGHDRSDGGLITTVLEMCFGGVCGAELTFPAEARVLETLFNEELGLVMEVDDAKVEEVKAAYAAAEVPCVVIGRTTAADKVTVRFGEQEVLSQPMTTLRGLWMATSFELEKLQCNPECVEQEQQAMKTRHAPKWELTFEPRDTPAEWEAERSKYKVAIIREEGSNGDREMTSAMYKAGFEPWDVHMHDLEAGTITLEGFRGIVFVGGFSYADALESARGWAASILFNPKVKAQFDAFYARPDTFSLGVCNGCQLMAQLGVVPFANLPMEKQPRFVQNKSGRFESRFVNVRVEHSNAIMLQGMEGSTLGVWVAHGEGRCFWPDQSVHDEAVKQNCVVMKYVDDDGEPTMTYPFNPNGSQDAIVGLASPDGRHLCMMPHPERLFMKFQWPYWPEGWTNPVSPWLKLFQNAREWCISHCSVCWRSVDSSGFGKTNNSLHKSKLPGLLSHTDREQTGIHEVTIHDDVIRLRDRPSIQLDAASLHESLRRLYCSFRVSRLYSCSRRNEAPPSSRRPSSPSSLQRSASPAEAHPSRLALPPP